MKNGLVQFLEDENIDAEVLAEQSGVGIDKLKWFLNHQAGQEFSTWAGYSLVWKSIAEALMKMSNGRFQNGMIFLNHADPPKALRLIIDQGTAPNEVIADILSDLSVIYKMTGGSGINFETEGIITLTV